MDWFKQSVSETATALGTDTQNGLSAQEAAKRMEQYGKNELKQGKKKSLWRMYFEQFKDVMVIVLLVAALISGVLLGEWVDAAIILFVVLLNALLGVIQENRAEKSLEALKKMSSPHAKVRRDGAIITIPGAELVPGDVVLLDAGDYVSADMRVSFSANLQVNESALTGESEPVNKQIEAIEGKEGEDLPLGDRHNLVFSGSLITYGRGEGIVVETGMNTQIGAIAGMLSNEEGVETPLQRRMADLGKKLAILCVGVCALVFLVGVLYGNDAGEMFMTAISLAVAAIPEGLLAIVTIVLAIGVQQMIAQNAIIRRLPAVETLGSATVICSDKTGTLTMNRMTVVATAAPFAVGDAKYDQLGTEFAHALALCNDGQPSIDENGEEIFTGDPTETALLDYAKLKGFHKTDLQKQFPRLDELPFDSEVKRMTTIHSINGKLVTYTKGGLDEVLVLCTRILEDGKVRPITDADLEKLQNSANEMAVSALRVLAFAMGEVPELAKGGDRTGYESELILIGLVGMIDPPRPTARVAVEKCKRAGIKPVMITGDHKVTASAIAKELGILEKGDRVLTGVELERMDDDRLREEVRNVAVYARVSPEHKVRIVKAWQSYGDVVAMTGDGVNDAPALKRADIGVAMGITGTEVSKEAAAMILTDDNFATIVEAVAQGRTIYANILKAIQFLLSSNLGEILVIFLATLFNWGTPLLPIHILWVNLITDTLPALALGMEPAEPDVMDYPPRDPKSPIFTKPLLFRVCYQGIMVAMLALCAFLAGNTVSPEAGHTMAFAVLSFSQLIHSFNLRSNIHSAFSRSKLNKWMFPALFAGLTLQFCVLFVPFLQGLFQVAVLTGAQWLLVAGLSIAPLVIVELFKAFGWTGESRCKRS
ncbi:MAG: calcium-translocating P-type ATPase, PMCA-type [Clostridia bacterium]